MVQLNKGQYFGVNVSNAALAGLRVRQSVYAPDTRLPWHSHAQPYLCLVAAGGFEERSVRRAESCDTRTVVWQLTSEEHDDTFGSSGARLWNIEFTDAWAERLADATRLRTYARGGEPTWLAARIIAELRRSDALSYLSVEGLVCALIAEVSRCASRAHGRRPAWLTRARDRLHAEYRSPPSVAELARDAGVHRSHFARAFRIHLGCTVADYVRRRRIEWAAAQLASHRHSLAELSLLAGFGDQPHFTRAFRRVMGVTPGEYQIAHGLRSCGQRST